MIEFVKEYPDCYNFNVKEVVKWKLVTLQTSTEALDELNHHKNTLNGTNSAMDLLRPHSHHLEQMKPENSFM